MASEYLSEALRYAERGIAVFPVRGKRPLTEHGHKDASTDPAVIEKMPWGSATGVAIATGSRSKLVVLDSDPKNGGNKSVDALVSRHGQLPPTATVRSGSGGSHFYFRLADGQTISTTHGKLGPGIDLLAEGAYVVAPPSIHPSGGIYSWIVDAELAPVPGWLLQVNEERKPEPAPPVAGGIKAGARNATLASLAGTMRRRGMETPEIEAALLVVNARRCEPPLDTAEVHSIAESIGAYASSATSGGSGADSSDAGPKSLQDLLKLAETAGDIEVIPSVLPGLPEGVGHAAGRIAVIGAFTGGGKTSLCVAEAIHLAVLGHPILIVTAELSGLEYARRIAQARDGDVGSLPISVLEVRGGIAEISKTVESWSQPLDGGNTPVVIVDYLQRLRIEGATSREREVAGCAEGLQTLSRKLGVIVIAAAQLNRKSQSETRPSLYHFRESGLIEQVADVALLVGQTASDRMYVIVGKNRWGYGAGDEIELKADFERCRFELLDQAQIHEPLAKRILEYLAARGGRLKLRALCRAIMVPGAKRHPRVSEIIEAGLATHMFVVSNGEVSKP